MSLFFNLNTKKEPMAHAILIMHNYCAFFFLKSLLPRTSGGFCLCISFTFDYYHGLLG